MLMFKLLVFNPLLGNSKPVICKSLFGKSEIDRLKGEYQEIGFECEVKIVEI